MFSPGQPVLRFPFESLELIPEFLLQMSHLILKLQSYLIHYYESD